MAEKNVQTRQYCAGHLGTFLHIQAVRSRQTIESTPGALSQVEECLRKSLTDTSPQVREAGRTSYWSFQHVWPGRAPDIISALDSMARKQLEKANPMTAEAPAQPRIPSSSQRGAVKRPSAISAILAEKRKEIAASRSNTPRAVTSPVIDRDILIGVPRSVSDKAVPTMGAGGPASPKSPTPAGGQFSRTMTSPPMTLAQVQGSQIPSPSRLPRRSVASPPLSPTQNADSRTTPPTRLPAGPPSGPGSPPNPRSPIRQHDTYVSGLRSPSSSSAGTHVLKTPHLVRAPLPSFDHNDQDAQRLRGTPQGGAADPSTAVLDEVLQAQAAQAVSAAEDLLALNEDHSPPLHPITPAKTPIQRPNGLSSSSYRTPATNFLNGNGFGSSPAPWEDSPRPESVTPQMLSKLRERKYERSWWLRQKELTQNTTPLRQSTSPSTDNITRSIARLSGSREQVSVVDLQHIALFAQDHSIPPEGDDSRVDVWRVWEDDRLFDILFEGLMKLLVPETQLEILENALVLLWELIQHQWILFEAREMSLADAFFRLRGHKNNTVSNAIFAQPEAETTRAGS